jgi:hypothetical protein
VIYTGLTVEDGGKVYQLHDPAHRQRYAKFLKPKHRERFARDFFRAIIQSRGVSEMVQQNVAKHPG